MNSAHRAAWLCAMAGCIGCVVVALVFEPRIDAAARRARNYHDRATINRRIAQAAPAVRIAERRILGLLETARVNPKTPAAAILRRLEALSARFHVTVIFVHPQRAAQGRFKGLTLEEQLAIRLRGRFIDLMRFVAELPASGMLLGIGGLDVSSKAAAASGSELEVRFEADRFRGLDIRTVRDPCCTW
ncbi:MAG: hypothetical protein NVS1B14_06480 [Vulcanimicrobiaceae bacterium]